MDYQGYKSYTDATQGPRYLNYDLHILYDYVQERSVSKVVLLFQDSEAFEVGFLADLVDILR